MIDRQPILLLSKGPVAQRIPAPGAAGAVCVVDDPFAALEAMADTGYGAVVVALPQRDLPNLLTAIRRLLKPPGRLYGLCTPAQEHELLQAGGLMDDYFILPPTPAEWRRILGDAEAPNVVAAAPHAHEPTLPARDLIPLIESASSPEDLARCVAELVGRACRTEVRWSSRQQMRPGVQQLLTLGEGPERRLFAVAPLEADEWTERWLSALRAVLGPLARAARRMELFRQLAITDDLTGAHNRRYFMHLAGRLLEEARRQKVRATLLLYDIDDFKSYNDEFGHAVGDEILRETANLMRQTTRKGDLVARVGGDEFAVLFCEFGPVRQPGSQPIQTPYQLADRFRAAVNLYEFKALGPKAKGILTISGGLASFPWDGATVPALLASADKALMAAKASGKNNIYLIGTGEPPENG